MGINLQYIVGGHLDLDNPLSAVRLLQKKHENGIVLLKSCLVV